MNCVSFFFRFWCSFFKYIHFIIKKKVDFRVILTKHFVKKTNFIDFLVWFNFLRILKRVKILSLHFLEKVMLTSDAKKSMEMKRILSYFLSSFCCNRLLNQSCKCCIHLNGFKRPLMNFLILLLSKTLNYSWWDSFYLANNSYNTNFV